MKDTLKKDGDFEPEDITLKNSVASAWECTGLTPTVPGGESEAASYADIYDIPVSHLGGNVAEYLDSLPEHIRRWILESGIPLDSVGDIQEYVSSIGYKQ